MLLDRPTVRRIACGLALAAAFSSCATETIYGPTRQALEASLASFEAGNLPKAEGEALSVLAMTGEVPNDYALQRFFAEYLLTQIHMRAAFEDPFIVPAGGAKTTFTLDGGRATAEPSSIAHLAAANYHAAYGRDGYGRAVDAPVEVNGEALLPAALAEFGARNAFVGLNLAVLTAHSRLRFDESVERMLEQLTDLGDLEACEALLATVQVPDFMQPWIYHAVFDRLRVQRPKEAYKFAIRALHGSSVGSTAVLVGDDREPVYEWIRSGSDYRFFCPEDRVEVIPQLGQCPGNCARELIDFEPLTAEEAKSVLNPGG